LHEYLGQRRVQAMRLLSILPLLLGMSLTAGEQTFTLTDHIGRHWQHELVTVAL
jgi:hypothetical protein